MSGSVPEAAHGRTDRAAALAAIAALAACVLMCVPAGAQDSASEEARQAAEGRLDPQAPAAGECADPPPHGGAKAPAASVGGNGPDTAMRGPPPGETRDPVPGANGGGAFALMSVLLVLLLLSMIVTVTILVRALALIGRVKHRVQLIEQKLDRHLERLEEPLRGIDDALGRLRAGVLRVEKSQTDLRHYVGRLHEDLSGDLAVLREQVGSGAAAAPAPAPPDARGPSSARAAPPDPVADEQAAAAAAVEAQATALLDQADEYLANTAGAEAMLEESLSGVPDPMRARRLGKLLARMQTIDGHAHYRRSVQQLREQDALLTWWIPLSQLEHIVQSRREVDRMKRRLEKERHDRAPRCEALRQALAQADRLHAEVEPVRDDGVAADAALEAIVDALIDIRAGGDLPSEIEQAMRDAQIVRINVEAGQDVDLHRHEIAGDDHVASDMVVAREERPGFMESGKVVRRALVSVRSVS